MNMLKNLPILLLLLIMAACSSDSDATLSEEGTPVRVTLRLSVAGNDATRADAVLDPDTNASANEMMKDWKVIVADANDKVVTTFEKSGLNNLETDEVTQSVTLIKGSTYHFYSFANLSWTELGFTDAPVAETDVSTLNTRTFSINGNDFNPVSGIPMSNRQTYTVKGEADESFDLIVVRMLAKMEFRFTNATTSALTVTGITLSDITSNVADNICLLPAYQTGENLNGPDDMGAGDLIPNLPTGATKADFTKTVNLSVGTNAEEAVTTTFYLNESQVAKDTYPGYFVITLSVSKDEGTSVEQRYSLLSWKEIARNDYRTIPIRLDDYSLEIIPYDFPAIGVYPASVREEDGKFTCTFHASGDFYIVPRVKQLSTGKVVNQTLWDVYSSDGATSITDESLLTPTSITNEDMYITDAALRYDADGRWSGGTSTNYSKYFKGTFAEEQYGTAEYDFTVKVTNSGDAAIYRFLKYKLYLIREE